MLIHVYLPSLNFVVYAASNKQYREAYLLYLREAVFCLEKEAAATSSAVHKAPFPLTSLKKSGGSRRSSSNNARRPFSKSFKQKKDGSVTGRLDPISDLVHNSEPCPRSNVDRSSSNGTAYPFVSI